MRAFEICGRAEVLRDVLLFVLDEIGSEVLVVGGEFHGALFAFVLILRSTTSTTKKEREKRQEPHH